MKKFLLKYRKLLLGVLLFLVILYLSSLRGELFLDPYSLILEDKDQNLLAATIAEDGQWRFPARDSLPEKYKIALIQFEDKRFYRHWGVDLRALARATRQNLQRGSVVSGGSTLSMQVIRMAQKNPKRNLYNKIKEIILATRLESRYSKKEILALYGAHAPFGGNVVGLEAASWRYYGKAPSLLSWAEAATLAVLPNSPALIHPGRNRASLKAKRDRLLDRLYEKAYLDEISWSLAKAESIPEAPLPLPQHCPHLLQRAVSDYKKGKLKSPRITTSINLATQQAVAVKLQRHQAQLKYNQIFNAAALVIHIPSKQILAYQGNVPGVGPDHGEMVDIIKAPRSTGSILKPFLYAMALEDGEILPHSLLSDTPVNYNGYRPENFKKDYNGAIPASEALSRSLNVPFVNLLDDYGLERFHLNLKKLGMSTLHRAPAHYGLTLVLGGAETTLFDITAMYAQMMNLCRNYIENDSQYLPETTYKPTYVWEDKTEKDKLLWQKEPTIYGAAAAWWTLNAMKEVKRPSSEGEWETFQSSKKVAWKTGTSFGFRDAWAIGTTTEYAVGVWVGNADGEGRPGLVGVQAAAPLLFDIFNTLPNSNWIDPPYDDFRKELICTESGHLAGRYCPSDTLRLVAGIQSFKQCQFHVNVQLDKEEAFRVNSNCYSPLNMKAKSWFILPPLQAFYYKRFNPEYRPMPPLAPYCIDLSERATMELIYPRKVRKIYVPVDLDGQLSRTVFEIAHSQENSILHWHVDERFVGTTFQLHSLELNPPAGQHLLTVVDHNGKRLEQPFEIIAKEKE